MLLLLATPSLITHLSCAYTESHLTQAQMVLAAKQATEAVGFKVTNVWPNAVQGQKGEYDSDILRVPGKGIVFIAVSGPDSLKCEDLQGKL